MCEFQHKNSSTLLTSMLYPSSAALEDQWQTILEVTDNRTHISEQFYTFATSDTLI
jgi:hypothetical protein